MLGEEALPLIITMRPETPILQVRVSKEWRHKLSLSFQFIRSQIITLYLEANKKVNLQHRRDLKKVYKLYEKIPENIYLTFGHLAKKPRKL